MLLFKNKLMVLLAIITCSTAALHAEELFLDEHTDLEITTLDLDLDLDLNIPIVEQATPATNAAQGFVRPAHVPEHLWNHLTPYFLPYDHPVREKLDKIFSRSRATQNSKSMSKAGFFDPYPYEWSRVVVSQHPEIPGFIVKAYLDSEPYHWGEPEYFFWLLRIRGADMIRAEIDKRQLSQFFKVPKKWIYPLPEHPAPPPKYLRKNFIMVVEDANIYSHKQSIRHWKRSPMVNKPMLKSLYKLIRDLGLADSRPPNLPFCRDGKIAFVDTEIYHEWPIKYSKMSKAFNSEMKKYWEQLTKKRK